MNANNILLKPLKELVNENPVYIDFFASFRIKAEKEDKIFTCFIDALPDNFWEENEISRHEFMGLFIDFASGIDMASEKLKVESLDVLPGFDKNNISEKCSLHMEPGEITCIVGPTGSGKSRLLSDIEWLANADTPTKRQVLINGKVAESDSASRFGGKLIAQITQNMNFVLDMDVENFLLLHAQSRFLPNAFDIVKRVISLANDLSGEPFEADTPVTFLSGGQSRALMIADVACIGQSPVVLIDEIENAGVNKKKALELLVSNDKIVLLATHDPLLILLADKRVVIKNGGMHKIIQTSDQEKCFYNSLEKLDTSMQMAKDFFRNGNKLLNGSELPINF